MIRVRLGLVLGLMLLLELRGGQKIAPVMCIFVSSGRKITPRLGCRLCISDVNELLYIKTRMTCSTH